MLGSLIAKYYDVLDIDSLPDPDISDEGTKKECGDIEKQENV